MLSFYGLGVTECSVTGILEDYLAALFASVVVAQLLEYVQYSSALRLAMDKNNYQIIHKNPCDEVLVNCQGS